MIAEANLSRLRLVAHLDDHREDLEALSSLRHARWERASAGGRANAAKARARQAVAAKGPSSWAVSTPAAGALAQGLSGNC